MYSDNKHLFHRLKNKTIAMSMVSSLSLLVACSSDSNTTPASSTSLSGTVSAPGGSIAFNPPTGLKKMLADTFFGKQAISALSGVSAVGAGINVELIEVDASGTQVGASIGKAVTDANGKYSLSVSGSFNPSGKYVLRAKGNSSNIEARVFENASDIDPISHATSELITAQVSTATDLEKVTGEIGAEIRSFVEEIAETTDLTGTSATVSAFSTAIKTAVNNDEEAANMLASTTAGGQICGTVKNASGVGLSGIRIVVRDFDNWVTRAKSRTNSAGAYCVRVPNGAGKKYILGALNFKAADMSASEWWSTGGKAYIPFDATAITVSDTTTVTKDFSLEAGALLQGTVTAAAGGSLAEGTALANVRVIIRNYTNFIPIGFPRVKADGSYKMVVAPGDYILVARNKSLLPYASEVYDGADGTFTWRKAQKVTLAAGTTTSRNFTLSKGYKLSGQVLDNVGGNPVTGIRLRINSGGPSFRLRTNKNGYYRIWLQPRTYSVQSYGNPAVNPDMSASNQTVNFTGPVGTITATLKDTSGNPISQGKLFLNNTSDGSLISQEISSSDGTVTLYSNINATARLMLLVDDVRSYGSSIYNGATNTAAATNVSATNSSNTDLGTITLPDGGVLSTNITSDGSTAIGGFSYEVYDGSGFFLGIGTRSDGTSKISLPAGTYTVRMKADGNVDCTSINITASNTTTLNYRTDTDTCS
ncbi:MAG: hypothetical protein OEY52_09155 [Gammaproteobacteria bacterium]|nr:hypothetical protein [Gammaproteobacteria bacterium]